MDSIVRGLSATLTVTFTKDGVPADPDDSAATVQIAHYDGTDLVPAGGETTRLSGGVYSRTIGPVTNVDELTAKWTGTFDEFTETVTTKVDVVGGVYFTVAQIRDKYPELVAETYSDTAVRAARALAEEAIEHACAIAFVPRLAVEQLGYPTPSGARPARRAVRTILSATDQDAATIDTTGLTVDGRWLALPSGWPTGNVLLAYEHGEDEPPSRIVQAAMILTREWLISGPITDRQTQLATEGGGAINLAVPGGRFGSFGIPEVDATIAQYERRVLVA